MILYFFLLLVFTVYHNCYITIFWSSTRSNMITNWVFKINKYFLMNIKTQCQQGKMKKICEWFMKKREKQVNSWVIAYGYDVSLQPFTQKYICICYRFYVGYDFLARRGKKVAGISQVGLCWWLLTWHVHKQRNCSSWQFSPSSASYQRSKRKLRSK